MKKEELKSRTEKGNEIFEMGNKCDKENCERNDEP